MFSGAYVAKGAGGGEEDRDVIIMDVDQVDDLNEDNGNDFRGNVSVQKLVYDYLVSGKFADTAKSFLKDIRCEAKDLISPVLDYTLEDVYASFLNSKSCGDKLSDNRRQHELLVGLDCEVGSGDSRGDINGDVAKKKRRRSSSQRRDSEGGDGMMVMKEETQKQYTFGWKRYMEYCQIHSLDPLVGENASAATQILEFARYLMHNPGKTVKSAVANSYVSAVGKKLLEANVITAMRDIRTPELKELFAEAGRAAANATSSDIISSPIGKSSATTIATTSSPVITVTAPITNDDADSEDSKKKKRV